jgi:hypothetical protein
MIAALKQFAVMTVTLVICGYALWRSTERGR